MPGREHVGFPPTRQRSIAIAIASTAPSENRREGVQRYDRGATTTAPSENRREGVQNATTEGCTTIVLVTFSSVFGNLKDLPPEKN